MKNPETNILFFHTKHVVIHVIERIETKVSTTKPMKVDFTQDGAIFEAPEHDTETIKVKERSYFKTAPRITFAGKIVPMTDGTVNSDMVEVHVGIAVAATEQFSRLRGRQKASKRAAKNPFLIIQCLESEVIPLFHKAALRLEPVIRESIRNKESLKIASHVEAMSLEAVLDEETPA